MTDSPSRATSTLVALRPWALVALGYLGLALVLTWPLALHLGDAVSGMANVDLFDTAWLRLSVARGLLDGAWPQSTELFFPAGYPVGKVVPNYLDHLLGAPLALTLPWPLADNLWWIGVLAANGLAGHVLGRQLGGTHAHGALVGVLLAASEPVLREANLGHAPQALVAWAPLFLASLIRALEPDGRWRHGLLAGLFLALCALTYWYLALFAAAVAVPAAAVALWTAEERRGPLARLGAAAAVCAALCLGPLLLPLILLGGGVPPAMPPDLQITEAATLVPEAHRWTFAQSGDPLWPLRPTPLDRTNRLSLVLLGAAVLGWRGAPRRWAWLVAALAIGTLIMGPYLKWGEAPVALGSTLVPLPGRFLAEVPVLSRLTWPQRWGVAVVLALLPLAARAPRPGWLAAAALLECLLLSGNAPLHTTTVAQYDGWRALSATQGSVFTLPLERKGPFGGSIAFAYRASGRPLASAVSTPPWAVPPSDWEHWRSKSIFAEWLARTESERSTPLPDHALRQLREQGFTAIALDTTPGAVSLRGAREGTARILARALGPPADYGSAQVWWLVTPEDAPAPLEHPDRWRERQRLRLAAEPPVRDRTVFRPLEWVTDR